MIILGVTIGEIATAALMIDGEIVAAAQEERFTRTKNYSGYPKNAIEFCLKYSNTRVQDIDKVVITSHRAGGIWLSLHQRMSSFSPVDYVREAHEYWYPVLYENKQVDYLEVFKDKLRMDTYPDEISDMIVKNRGRVSAELSKEVRKAVILRHLDIPEDKIVFEHHHLNHCFYGYYGSPFAGDNLDTLVFTADSFGDDCNATINIFRNKEHSLYFKTANQNLGRLYRNMTVLLGMKPYEHEYKVMGLAPYAPKSLADEAYDIFKRTLDVNGVDFFYHERPIDNYFWYKERLEGIRFDGVAAGLQKYFEEIMSKWIRNGVRATKIGRVAFSGGLSMNIKLNQVIHNLEEVEYLAVPACGDDNTLSIGACFVEMHRYLKGKNLLETLKPFENVCLGPDVSQKEIDEVMKGYKLNEKCDIVTEQASPRFISKKISEGKIIGRCTGRMEFGARALGNRSILADPRDMSIVERINKAIKKRDFWMPFTPTIIETDWSRYLRNSKNIYAPHMTIGFDTTYDAIKDIPACLHQADKTCRPQMLRKQDNVSFYEIISSFKEITGIGAVLNTSFNIHGYPIVATAKDAVETFLDSDMDAILLNDTYIEKRKS